MEFKIDESLGFLIARVTFIARRRLRALFKEHGLDISAEQWGVLNILWEAEGFSQVELADRTFKNKPNLTRIIDALEKKELVVRQKDKNDRRVYKIYLTEKGRKLKTVLIPIALEGLEKLQRGFSEEELRQLKLMLNRLYKNLK